MKLLCWSMRRPPRRRLCSTRTEPRFGLCSVRATSSEADWQPASAITTTVISAARRNRRQWGSVSVPSILLDAYAPMMPHRLGRRRGYAYVFRRARPLSASSTRHPPGGRRARWAALAARTWSPRRARRLSVRAAVPLTSARGRARRSSPGRPTTSPTGFATRRCGPRKPLPARGAEPHNGRPGSPRSGWRVQLAASLANRPAPARPWGGSPRVRRWPTTWWLSRTPCSPLPYLVSFGSCCRPGSSAGVGVPIERVRPRSRWWRRSRWRRTWPTPSRDFEADAARFVAQPGAGAGQARPAGCWLARAGAGGRAGGRRRAADRRASHPPGKRRPGAHRPRRRRGRASPSDASGTGSWSPPSAGPPPGPSAPADAGLPHAPIGSRPISNASDRVLDLEISSSASSVSLQPHEEPGQDGQRDDDQRRQERRRW